MQIPYQPPQEPLPVHQHFHVPAFGGMDKATAKSQVAPGTLEDCLNYEVGLSTGYKPVDGLMNYVGRGYTVPKTFIQGLIVGNYSGASFSDFQPGGLYYIGAYNFILERVTVNAIIRYLGPIVGNPRTDHVYYDVVSGDMNAFLNSFSGQLLIMPAAGGLTIGDEDAAPPGVILAASENAIIAEDFDNYDELHTMIATNLCTGNSEPSGAAGAVTGMFFFNEKLYVARGDADGSSLYTTTDLLELAATPAWSEVDLGYEVGFDGGEVDPVTFYSREFLDDSEAAQDDLSGLFGAQAESIQTAEASGLTGGPSTDTGVWLQPENANNDAASAGVAASYRRPLATSIERQTQILRLTKFNADVIEGITTNTASPVGVEVEIKYGFDVSSGMAGTGNMERVTLTGVGSSENKAVATARTANGTMHTSTLGGATDTWTSSSFSLNSIQQDEFGIDIILKSQYTSGTPTSTSYIVNLVEHVKMTVYFEDATSTVYFWNGVSDVSTGVLVNVALTESTFSRGDAAGYMTFYSVSSPASVVDNLEIRTAASGAGNLIALTNGAMSANLLPSPSEMLDANAVMVTKEINFFIDESKEALYGATGAGPAFHFNGTHFWFIRTPVPAAKDTPRYLTDNQNSLVLSFDSGSILVSPPGQPSVFSGLLGATEFGFSEPITGLRKLNGTALGVWCEESIHALTGTSVNNYTPQVISANSGALNYTVADMGQPIYTDFAGIANIQASQTYGDFSWGRLTYLIGEYIQNKIQDKTEALSASTDIVMAIPVRNKNQYRLYFRDGYVVTMTMFGADGSQPMMTVHNYGGDSQNVTYVPTASASMITSKGKEVIAIGCGDGNVYILDAGNPGIYTSGGVTTYDYRLTFNPFFAGAPYLNIKYSEVMVHLKSAGYETFTAKAGVNFLVPNANEDAVNLTVGASTNLVDLTLPFNRVSAHLPNITDGFTLQLEGTADGRPTHIVQALTYKGTPLSDTNSSSKVY